MPDPEVHDVSSSAPPAMSGRKKSAVVIALLMILEGAGIFILARFLAPTPPPVAAAAPDSPVGESNRTDHDLVEVSLGECRPTNRVAGKLITMQLEVSILVPAEHAERLTGAVETQAGRIRDRINFVFRSAEPAHLGEPGLETVKRRLKAELERVFDAQGIVKEVLIPQLLQSGTGL